MPTHVIICWYQRGFVGYNGISECEDVELHYVDIMFDEYSKV